MELTVADILARSDENGLAQLFIVIAVVAFSLVGAVFEKLKKSQSNMPPRRPVPPPVPPQPSDRPETGRTPFPPVVAGPWPPTRPPAAPPSARRPRKAAPQQPKTPRQRMRDVFNETDAARSAPVPRSGGAQTIANTLAKAAEATNRGTERTVADHPEPSGAVKPVRQLHPAGDTAQSFRPPTVAELRRAIVLNELLGPPVALRETPGKA